MFFFFFGKQFFLVIKLKDDVIPQCIINVNIESERIVKQQIRLG